MPPSNVDVAMAPEVEVHFDHVQLMVDSVEDLATYTAAAARQNAFVKDGGLGMPTDKAAAAWGEQTEFVAAGQDVILQMIHGLSWRITGRTDIALSHGTQSYLVESPDPRGVKVLVTAKVPPANGNGHAAKRGKTSVYNHFQARRVEQFMKHQSGRQGIAVLAFTVARGTIDMIETRYRAKHPTLLVNPESPSAATYDAEGFKILDVYAYYKGEVGQSEVDPGTVIRFVQRAATAESFLPGIDKVAPEFSGDDTAAYFDHWVSNVVSRTGFLQTLSETLDFDIKVDFNAGVVAAGEAQIESTVTGNVGTPPGSFEEGQVSHSQVFLPTNNALSAVGHVHLFLEEIGQGIQHIASRVNDLTEFIARVNRVRQVTGQGFTFLKIPHSYYGMLTTATLDAPAVGGVGLAAPVSSDLAAAVLSTLQAAGLVDPTGIVGVDATRTKVAEVLEAGLAGAAVAEEYKANAGAIADAVVRARYSNLYKLIGDHLDEEKYLKIVKNQILVDIQNGDILYQIFTCNVLQRELGHEAPFFEFIQRVCSRKTNPDGSAKPIKAGCGGFGIRNFLTLFLSIEVTKAMNEKVAAAEAGNAKGEALATKKIEIFTNQLGESNPILTAITDAMTAQGDAKDRLLYATTPEAKAAAEADYATAEASLKTANAALLECSTRHSEWMRTTVEEGSK